MEAAIDSALAQTRPADEIVVSDDNSTDNTVALCRKYGDRVRVEVNPSGPSGFVNGWNNAIRLAKGEYITILHQDDLLDADFLAEIDRAIEVNPDVLHFFAPCRYIDQNGRVIRESQPIGGGGIQRYSGQEYAEAYIHSPGHIHRCPGVVTHRSIFDRCGYREEAGHIADNDFFIRVGAFTDVVGILKPLASYREHTGSETGHLRHLEINTRLLNDYHFQIVNRADSPMLSKAIFDTFVKWEAEYIHRLIVFGLKAGEFRTAANALQRWFYNDKVSGRIYIKHDTALLKRALKNKMKGVHGSFLIKKAAATPVFAPKGRVMVLAPHPDDEVIGCAGLIQRLVAEGRAPEIVIMTGGEGSHRGCCTVSADAIKANRSRLTSNAMELLGVAEEHIHRLNFPDGGINANHSEAAALAALITGLKPDTILVPHWGEGWPDHTAVRDIACKLAPRAEMWEYCVWMWYYNIWRGLDWKSAAHISLTTKEQTLKNKAINAYIQPVAPCGRPWSGVLPAAFVAAHRKGTELYFKVK